MKSWVFFLYFNQIRKLTEMDNSITIVFCTKAKEGETDAFIEHLRDTCGCEATIMCVKNPNGVSLSKIYADMVDNKEIHTDIIVFVHDDIEFLKDGWGAEVIRLFNDNKKYGIIGVAGSAQFDEKGAWWNYEKKFGQVLHRNDGKSWLTAFSPLLEKDLQEVAVIDGLFIALHKKRITNNFSRDLESFDMYDIDFSLSNLLSGKCKIGVTTNIRLAHNSIGQLRPSWYENREIINKKYGKQFPIDILNKKIKW